MKKNIIYFVVLLSIIQQVSLAQNVGIGTSSPTEKLTIVGNAQANSFKYTVPKTLYYSVNEAAFKARIGSETVYTSSGTGGAYIINGGGYGMTAPVNLPQNAKIKSITLYVYDVSFIQDFTAHFVNQLSSSYTFLATMNTSGYGGLTTQTYTFATPLVINNSSSSYEFFIAPNTGSWNTSDIQVKYVIFEYTIDETN